MSYYGYHRVSSKEQHLDRGIIEIRTYCEEHQLPLTNILQTSRQAKISTGRVIR